MPRESAEAIAAENIAPAPLARRPKPPLDQLDEVEAEIWHSIVAALPPDWFKPETEPILVELCQHICMSRLISRQMSVYKTKSVWTPKDAKVLFNLVKMKSTESRLVAALSTKLRLTAGAKHKTGKRALKQLSDRKPWELPDDEEDEAA